MYNKDNYKSRISFIVEVGNNMIKQFIYKIKSAISNQIILLLLITVLLIVLGIACTELGNSYETNNKIISYIFTVVSSIFSACASITGVSAIWELIGKKTFTNELYQRFNISMSLVNSGISEVFYNEENLSWDKELQKTKKLEIFSCGDSSWIDNHKKTILDFLEKKGKQSFICQIPEIIKLWKNWIEGIINPMVLLKEVLRMY